MHTGSKYMTDPELIKKSKETAYSFIPYADIHSFCKPLETPDAYAEEEAVNVEDDKEEVDEEIEAETSKAEAEGEPASKASTSASEITAPEAGPSAPKTSDAPSSTPA